MKYTANVIEDWLDRCATEGVNLTPWEEQFIESVTDQFDRSGHISDAQVATLERIYTEKVP